MPGASMRYVLSSNCGPDSSDAMFKQGVQSIVYALELGDMFLHFMVPGTS